MRLRRRRRVERATARTLSAGLDLRVVLDQDDLISALPTAFRDTVNAAHTQAVEALRLAQGAQQRVGWLEERVEQLEAGSTEALRAEFTELKDLIVRSTGARI